MDTPFNLASASKMFTAVAIAQLAEQKKLRFDDPLGHYLHELPPELAKVRIDQALTHTGGIRGLTQLTPAIAAQIQGASNARQLVPLIAEAGLAFEPGSKTEYSNGGFVLLGAVVEAVSGKTFREYVTENILAKAGMTGTTFAEPAAAPVRLSRMAPGAPPGGRARTRIGGGTTPAGGWYASARDLVRFVRALREKRLVSGATLDALLTPRTSIRSGQSSPTSSEQRGYGYGFGILETGNDKIVGHNGGAPGTNSEVAGSVRSGWTAVALSNIDPPAATNLMTFARQVILGGSGTTAQCDAIAATPGPF
jgi:CubicO group peptidase (beta-lactamase class C family)